MDSHPGDVTALLKQVRDGEVGAQDRLASLVYRELRKLAASKLRAERQGHTLSPTALANEAWVRFGSGIPQMDLEDRRHFYGVAATSMRRILVEYARRKNAVKRGEGAEQVEIEAIDPAAPNDERLVRLDEALTRLASIRPRSAHVVELRFFGGFTHSEIAEQLNVERRTVDRDWEFAKAWLFGELRSHP
jgi:RNA polymerase sigma-70 factor, ECF subfamily